MNGSPFNNTFEHSIQQYANFDSAVQLNEDGLLPASQTSKIDQNLKTFAVIPVGTTRYRPPESSQLIISNDISSISLVPSPIPPLQH